MSECEILFENVIDSIDSLRTVRLLRPVSQAFAAEALLMMAEDVWLISPGRICHS